MMNELIDVLMKRDGLSEHEAKMQVQDVREMMMEAIEAGDYDEVENIMYSELGLEMDYIDYILM